MGSITVLQTPTLNSTNVAASAYLEWAVGTAYTTGDRVKVSVESDGTTPKFPIREYQASGATTGDYPPTAAVTQWVEVGAQNAHAMFDLMSDQRTVADEGEAIEVSVNPAGRINRVALLGLRNVSSVTVEVIVDATTVFSQTQSGILYNTPVGYWTWLFERDEYSFLRSLSFEIPGVYLAPTVTITLNGVDAECGWCIVGRAFDLGPTDWEAEPNPKDYSAYRTSEFGVTTFVARRVADDVRGTLWVETTDYNRVYSLLRGNMNTLALFDLNNEQSGAYSFDALRVYGKLESVSGGLAYGKTPINIKISGIS